MPRQKSTHVDDPAAVGRRLKEARARAGLSQRELSFLGCSPAYISRIEAGDRIPSLQLLRELGRRLGVTEDYLATGTELEEGGGSPRLVEAEVGLRLGETEHAEALFVEILERSPSDRDRARALTGLGQVAFRAGDLHGAIERLEEALAAGDSAGIEQPGAADALGRAYAAVGQLESAISILRRYLDAAEARDDSVERVRFGVLLANALIDTGSFGQAQELLGRTLALAEDSRDPIMRARLYWTQSRLHTLRNDAETGARYARRALELIELTEHTQFAARAHQLLAHIELERGRPEEALELLRQGRPLVVAGSNWTERVEFRLEEARALAQLGRKDEAASLAMEISGVLVGVDSLDAGRGYALLAEIYDQLGDRARARELYELAAELLEASPTHLLVSIYSHLADLLEAEGRTEEALDVLKKAVTIQAGSPARQPNS